jgi:glycosyltransferase involved in cell wall biosynthesis/SAM-dependent methyltransferase
VRVALFTPLPPARTGTADYAAELIPALQEFVKVTVYDKVPAIFRRDGFDAVVYQIGNNPFHADIYRMALREPGIVVLHEANVHHLVQNLTLNRGNRRAYLREVAYEIFGKDTRGGLGALPLETPQSHTFTILRRLLDRSRACIVHSGYAERQIRLKGFRGPVLRLPHGADVRIPDARGYRQALGIEDGVALAGVFGYQRPDKQIWDCLLALHELVSSLPNLRLLILGQQHPQVPLEEGIRDLGLEERVLLRGYQDQSDFNGYLGACDVVLNLRETTFGEASGTMMRAFGMGKPVIVSDVGSGHELPDDTCLKIPRDRHERQVITECLRWLIANPDAAAAIGANAQHWVAEECAWPKVARRYTEFLALAANEAPAPTATGLLAGATAPPLKRAAIHDFLARWVDSRSPAGTYFQTHSTRLVRTLELIPRGQREHRILELGCYMQITPALRSLLGYGEVQGGYLGRAGGRHRSQATSRYGEEFSCIIDLFNVERDRFPYPDEYFQTVLCCELLEHLEADPMHMMSEIHRVLEPAGTLVLTTPNAASWRALGAVWLGLHPNLFGKYAMPGLIPESRHAREYTPKELLRLMSDSGFLTQHIETGPYGESAGRYRFARRLLAGFSWQKWLREECVFLVAQKGKATGSRYPSWLYEQS